MQDIPAPFHQFRKSPGFKIIVVPTLALDIGPNVGTFTSVHAVLMRTLPVPRGASFSIAA